MGRPKKNNAEYFSHDAGMRNHRHVKILRSKFEWMGPALWCSLLEVMCEADHFKIPYDTDDEKLALAVDLNCTMDECHTFINAVLAMKLVQLEGGLLFSPNFIERMEPLIFYRERKRKGAEKKKSDDSVTVLAGNNEVVAGNNGGFQPAETHSIVKESKVKESKGKVSGYPDTGSLATQYLREVATLVARLEKSQADKSGWSQAHKARVQKKLDGLTLEQQIGFLKDEISKANFLG